MEVVKTMVLCGLVSDSVSMSLLATMDRAIAVLDGLHGCVGLEVDISTVLAGVIGVLAPRTTAAPKDMAQFELAQITGPGSIQKIVGSLVTVG